LYITEGPLKADVARYLAGGALFAGLTGVNAVQFLPELIKTLKPRRIVECLDMDKINNLNVRKALGKLQSIAIPLCQEYKPFYWSEDYKGMQANKISIRGRIFFVPKQNLGLVSLFEDYVSAIAAKNNNVGDVVCNSMYVVDDEKQRLKMKEEFYANYKRDIEEYQERIQKFIANGGNSKAVIERWIKRIEDLKAKKSAYEDILRQQLCDLDDDFDVLNVQAQELMIRSGKFQQLDLAA
jgi:hypothetical protein